MSINFFETMMGHKFYNHDVPSLIKAVERLANALEVANSAKEDEWKREAEKETYHREKMFSKLKHLAKDEDMSFEVVPNQLHALWVAYCIHAGYEVDTAPYDNDLMALWDEMAGNETNPFADFDAFDDFMCKDLV